jgi:hypothetical protein
MKRVAGSLAAFVLCAAIGASTAQAQQPQTQAGTLVLLARTKIELAVAAPVWAKSAKAGDPIYAQTDFPVVAGSAVAIPPGTYVQGRIEAVTEPTWRTNRAEIQVLFTKIVFANGYAIALPDPREGAHLTAPPTAMKLTVDVSKANDLLLDNGAQMEMMLAAPLALDTRQTASALALSRPRAPGSFQSATLCRPTPGSPGTPDTVIPGTPGTPGTTFPGGPGMPDITIPGTPDTPPTVIPGTPETEWIACPAAPSVIASEPVGIMPEPQRHP